MMIKMIGGSELIAKLGKMKQRIAEATRAALYQRALQIMALSDSMVPVDTGRLRASHFVSVPDDTGKMHLGYGVKYALPVHERLDVKHEHGQAKFLETAFNTLAPGTADWMAKKIAENVKAGVKLRTGAYPTSPVAALEAGKKKAKKQSRRK